MSDVLLMGPPRMLLAQRAVIGIENICLIPFNNHDGTKPKILVGIIYLLLNDGNRYKILIGKICLISIFYILLMIRRCIFSLCIMT